LLEQVRLRTIESAFQHDFELAIQRAADEMIQSSRPEQSVHTSITSSYTSGMNSALNTSPKLTARLDELEQLNKSLSSQLEKIKSQQQQESQSFKQLNDKLLKSEAEKQKLASSYDDLNTRYNELNTRLINEILAKHDLETELSILNKSRTETIQDFHSRSEMMIQTKIKDLEQRIHEKQMLIEHIRGEYEDLDRKYNMLKNAYDVEVMKRAQSNANEYEIHQLKLVIAELRKTLYSNHMKTKHVTQGVNDHLERTRSSSDLELSISSSSHELQAPKGIFIDEDGIKLMKQLLDCFPTTMKDLHRCLRAYEQQLHQVGRLPCAMLKLM
jgi:chromosome segregation ATPase